MRQNGKKQSVELSLLHKKVGNVNVDQHWEYPGRDVDWLCTWQPCLKLYVLTILKELMSRTKEQRYESLQAIWDNSRIIDDLNDIAVLVNKLNIQVLTKSKLMIKLSSVDTKAL
jgi:hypothetical protein